MAHANGSLQTGFVGTALGEEYGMCRAESPRSVGSSGGSDGSKNRCYSCCNRLCCYSCDTARCYCCTFVVRCSLLKCGACCWAFLLVVFTIAVPVFMFFLWGNQGSNSYNKDVINDLGRYAADGLRFTDICRFKQWTGTARITNPDILGMIHHEGVMLNTVTADGYRKGFLQLDYGHYGSFFAYHLGYKPVRLYGKDHLDWRGPSCPYECGKVTPLYQNPSTFLEMFELYRGWKYNVFWYNCYDFAHLVWNWTQPTDVRCMLPRDMALRFDQQTHI